MDSVDERALLYVRDDYMRALENARLTERLESPGGEREPMLVRYLRSECEESYRIQVKRLLVRWGASREESERTRRACEVLLCVLDRLLVVDGLRGKKGKYESAYGCAQLRTLVDLGEADGARSWQAHAGTEDAKGRRAWLADTRNLLSAAHERLVDDPSLACEVSDHDLLDLVAATLSLTIRNERTPPAERVMELVEDMRLSSVGVSVDGDASVGRRDSAGPGTAADCGGRSDRDIVLTYMRSKVREELIRFACVDWPESGGGGGRKTAREPSLHETRVEWWHGLVSERDVAGLSRVATCMLYAKAETFLGDRGLQPIVSDDAGAGDRRARRTGDRRIKRATSLPMGLAYLYLCEVEGNDRRTRASNDDVATLVECLSKPGYEMAIVPVSVDPRTGGGLYVMGWEQVKRYCARSNGCLDHYPAHKASPILVDHALGVPYDSFVFDAEQGRVPAIAHVVRVVDPLSVAFEADGWAVRRMLDDLWRQYDLLSATPRPNSIYRGFWSTFNYDNESMGRGMPEGCPTVFASYFKSERAARNVALSLSEEEFGEDLATDECAVIPRCLGIYILKINGEGMGDASVWNFDKVARGEAPISYTEAQLRMGECHDHMGIADVCPVVVRSRRSQERWWEILRAAALTDESFRRFYVGVYARNLGLYRADYGIGTADVDAWLRETRVERWVLEDVLPMIEDKQRERIDSSYGGMRDS